MYKAISRLCRNTYWLASGAGSLARNHAALCIGLYSNYDVCSQDIFLRHFLGREERLG